MLKDRKIHLLMLAGFIFTLGFLSNGALEKLPDLTPEPLIPCVGELSGDFQCYKKYYEVLTKNQGAAAAMAEMKTAYDTSVYIRSQCHQLTHSVGNIAYEKTKSIPKAFLDGNGFCWSGYYHGVVERAVGMEGADKVKEGLNDFCAEMTGKERYSFDYYNCVHGLGHGLMSMTKNELFQSLDLCSTLTGEWEKSSCYGGAFMENVMTDYRNHKTDYLKEDDLLYPCTGVEERYKYQCYLMQTSYVLKKNGYNFTDVFKRCDAVPAPYNEVCAQSAGRDASGSTISDPIETKKRCDLAPNALLYHNCIVGAVKDFVSYFHSDKEARGFCTLLEKGESESCDALVTSYYSTFAP